MSPRRHSSVKQISALYIYTSGKYLYHIFLSDWTPKYSTKIILLKYWSLIPVAFVNAWLVKKYTNIVFICILFLFTEFLPATAKKSCVHNIDVVVYKFCLKKYIFFNGITYWILYIWLLWNALYIMHCSQTIKGSLWKNFLNY